MLDGLNRMRRVVFMALDPAGEFIDRLEAPEWLMRLFGISLSGAIIGGAIWAVEGTRAGLFASAAAILLLLLVLMTLAAMRLQARNEQLEAPPKRPHNWESLIRKVRAWEQAGSTLAVHYHAVDTIQRDHPALNKEPDRVVVKAFREAQRELTTEIDIAGTAFDGQMALSFVQGGHAISFVDLDTKEYDADNFQAMREKIHDEAEKIVRRLSNASA